MAETRARYNVRDAAQAAGGVAPLPRAGAVPRRRRHAARAGRRGARARRGPGRR